MKAPKPSSPPRPRPSGPPPAPSERAGFSKQVLERRPVAKPSTAHESTSVGEDLADLEYSKEIRLKDESFQAYWRDARLGGRPEALVPSPRPRGYRTTSKRRVARFAGAAHLFLGEREPTKGHRKSPFVPSVLEPAEHTALFRFLQAKLSEPNFRIVTEHLGWLILRGSYEERAVIFNVDQLSGPVVRKLKSLGTKLAELKNPSVAAAYVYVDDTDSDYYLEARRPKQGVAFKKLFGADSLQLRVDDLQLRYSPTSFSQVNESILPEMLRLAAELLAPTPRDALLDLYCGYGLLSLALSGRVRDVTGLDMQGPSIESAKKNARNLRRSRARYLPQRVTPDAIRRIPAARGSELVILDPPRKGTAPGVIAAVAARRPRRALHVFCSVDQIPRALGEWSAAGYAPTHVAPIDMFPGTPGLEVLVLLEPSKR